MLTVGTRVKYSAAVMAELQAHCDKNILSSLHASMVKSMEEYRNRRGTIEWDRSNKRRSVRFDDGDVQVVEYDDLEEV